MSTDEILRKMSEAHLSMKLEELGKERAIKLMEETFGRNFVEIPHHACRVSAWYERHMFPYDTDDEVLMTSKYIWEHPNWDKAKFKMDGTGWTKPDSSNT